MLLGVRVAAQPADNEHRFGHGKAEALAALVQVILISLSALFIGARAIQRLLTGAQTANAELGIVVSVIAMALTLALITYQRRSYAARAPWRSGPTVCTTHPTSCSTVR